MVHVFIEPSYFTSFFEKYPKKLDLDRMKQTFIIIFILFAYLSNTRKSDKNIFYPANSVCSLRFPFPVNSKLLQLTMTNIQLTINTNMKSIGSKWFLFLFQVLLLQDVVQTTMPWPINIVDFIWVSMVLPGLPSLITILFVVISSIFFLNSTYIDRVRL